MDSTVAYENVYDSRLHLGRLTTRQVALDHGCCFTAGPSPANRQQRVAKEPLDCTRVQATALSRCNDRRCGKQRSIPKLRGTCRLISPRLKPGALRRNLVIQGRGHPGHQVRDRWTRPGTSAPSLKPRRAFHRHRSSRIVGIHWREGKEIARRSGGDDVRHIAGSQGHRPAGPDEIINLVWVQGTEHRAFQMVDRSVSLRCQAMSAISEPVEAARTALAAAESTTRTAVPEAALEEAAAAASPAERTGTAMAQASANRARITNSGSAAAAATRSAAEPASEVARMRMTAPDRAARIAAKRLDRGRNGGLSGRLSMAGRRHGRGMTGSKMLLLTQPRTYGGDSTQPHEPGTRAATRTETAVTTMEQPPPGAKAAVVPAGSEAAATVPKAAAGPRPQSSPKPCPQPWHNPHPSPHL